MKQDLRIENKNLNSKWPPLPWQQKLAYHNQKSLFSPIRNIPFLSLSLVWPRRLYLKVVSFTSWTPKKDKVRTYGAALVQCARHSLSKLSSVSSLFLYLGFYTTHSFQVSVEWGKLLKSLSPRTWHQTRQC